MARFKPDWLAILLVALIVLALLNQIRSMVTCNG